MLAKKWKKWSALALAAAVFAAVVPVGTAMSVGQGEIVADAAEDTTYNELYRNQFAYSPAKNWNNDPNGMLYVPSADGTGGTYHMYYQYNPNGLGWGNISWGHATSTDLVHWTEQPVAIYAGQDVGGVRYEMMFSGSAVYDERNSSGLFETDGDGTVKDGQGIVAVLTQPSDAAGGQRQILAYSKDNGASFTIWGEILGADDDGGIGDGEFRDPKVFWEPTLNRWLMAVGGGSVRMYASDDLLEWEYLGETGYWGECPDLSAFTVGGETKYVLILSPEDKEKSHIYNGTTRYDAYYPSEYYVVGSLDENGLFIGETPLTRLSQGIDSYAFQSFNNAPDGKVYGISWAASWKTVGEYEALREHYNGGMTVACELELKEENGSYVLTRNPVDALTSLRGGTIATYDGVLPSGENALDGTEALTSDLEITLDFSRGNASAAEIALRASDAEKLIIRYDTATETLSLDRSESSLAAADTSLFQVKYSVGVPLDEDGVLSLRILLDRASVSLFANDGAASFFTAFFPSVNAKGMSLTADGDLGVTATVYAMGSIFFGADDQPPENNKLYLSASKIDGTVGNTYAVAASMLTEGFSNSDAVYTVEEGAAFIRMEQKAEATYITLTEKGFAKIAVSAGGQTGTIEIFIYEDGFVSDLVFPMRWGGFRLYNESGLLLSTDASDAFLFSDTYAENFVYSAVFTPKDASAQAAALVIGAAENYTGYYVVTADLRDGLLKLWRSGTGDLSTARYAFAGGEPVKLRATMTDGTLRVYVNGNKNASLTYFIDDYQGGLLGLNVYNGEFTVNHVSYASLSEQSENTFSVGNAQILSILNVTDGNAILSSDDYTYADGNLTLSESYLLTLCGDTAYTLKINTAEGAVYITFTTKFSAVSVSMQEESCDPSEGMTLRLGRDTTVLKIVIGGKEVGFVQDGRTIAVSADELSGLTDGSYTVTLYTQNGKTEADVVFLRPDMSAQNRSMAASLICLGIAAAVALGTADAYLFILLRKKTVV